MNKLLRKIFNHPLLLNNPPVLVDIGASGRVHPAWKQIARYSICIAFDADSRDFKVTKNLNSGYKKLYLINRAVTSTSVNEIDFYLTRSPHCSSALAPNTTSLKDWAFSDLFDVVEVKKMPSISLTDAFDECGIHYVDWYKSDTQGMDLRLFASLSQSIRKKIIAAEFEPGILDGYLNEDKLHSLMGYMEELPFWISKIQLKGSPRINRSEYARLSRLKKRFLRFFLRTPPGWCEITYLNKFDNKISERDLLLGWVISTIKGENGFAMFLARQGTLEFDNILFNQMYLYSKKELNSLLGYAKAGLGALRRLAIL